MRDNVVPFAGKDRPTVRSGESARVIVLPVVRVERHEDDESPRCRCHRLLPPSPFVEPG